MAEETKRKKISDTLIAEIGAGKFTGRFPSERTLVRRFAAARETVRAALRDLEAMRLSPVDPAPVKSLLRDALTDKIDDRETFMKGIDYSYYYEQSE